MSMLFTIAVVVGGTVLGFQFILLLLGMGDDGAGPDASAGGDVSGHDPAWHEAADADLGHPESPWFYEVLSLRTLSAAVTFFGLGGKAALGYGYSEFGAFVLASLAGLAAMYGVYWLFKQAYKMQHSGSENVRNAVGAPATVYVPVPAKRGGAGKVMFRLQNRLVEYQAVTDEEERLPTGEKVIVVAVVNSDTVRVGRAAASLPESAAPSQEQDMIRSV